MMRGTIARVFLNFPNNNDRNNPNNFDTMKCSLLHLYNIFNKKNPNCQQGELFDRFI